MNLKVSDMDILDWQSQGDSSHMLVDEDYLAFMSDTLFTTITSNQPFAFPDTREIGMNFLLYFERGFFNSIFLFLCSKKCWIGRFYSTKSGTSSTKLG